MRQLKFSLPFYSIIPIGLGIGPLWAFFNILSLLRFVNCPAWEFFQSTPGGIVQITGAWEDHIYLQSSESVIYCNEQSRWKKCTPPVYSFSQTDAPAWFKSRFSNVPESSNVKQLVRMEGTTVAVTYYALLENGKIWSCRTDYTTETNNLLYSFSVIWLLIPAGIGISSAAWFMNIFIKEGAPTLWDFFGHGERIK